MFPVPFEGVSTNDANDSDDLEEGMLTPPFSPIRCTAEDASDLELSLRPRAVDARIIENGFSMLQRRCLLF